MDWEEIRARAQELGLSAEGDDPLETVRAIQRAEGFIACFRSGRTCCVETRCTWMSGCIPEEFEQLVESAGVGARTGPWRR
jgi:hypothetical protein